MSRQPPRQWTPDIKAELCRRVAEGKTILSLAGKGDFPSQSAIYAELRRDPEFAKEYEAAREWQLTAWEDEIIEMASDAGKDRKPDGSVDLDHIARMKLAVNTKQWVMARRNPRRYGDRVSAELTGRDGGPLQVEHERSPMELARMVAFALEVAKRNPAPEPVVIEAKPEGA